MTKEDLETNLGFHESLLEIEEAAQELMKQWNEQGDETEPGATPDAMTNRAGRIIKRQKTILNLKRQLNIPN